MVCLRFECGCTGDEGRAEDEICTAQRPADLLRLPNLRAATRTCRRPRTLGFKRAITPQTSCLPPSQLPSAPV